MLESIDAVEWLRSLPDDCADLIVTDPPYESLEKHRAVGTTDAPQAQQGFQQRLVSHLPKQPVQGAVVGAVPGVEEEQALLHLLRPGDDVRAEARCRGGRLPLLEADRVGQDGDGDGLPLSRAVRIRTVLRERQAQAQRSLDPGRTRVQTGEERIPGGEAAGADSDSDHAELRGRRARPRSILRVGHHDSRESSARDALRGARTSHGRPTRLRRKGWPRRGTTTVRPLLQSNHRCFSRPDRHPASGLHQ